MKTLYKTTLIIWSEEDPNDMEISDIAREAEMGQFYCSKRKKEEIENPEKDSDWDGTEFFGVDEKSCEAERNGERCLKDSGHENENDPIHVSEKSNWED